MNPLLAFYYGSRKDSEGRYLSDILAEDDAWLEYTHDYIQWLFPLREASQFNPSAPLIDDEVVAAFAADDLLRAQVHASFVRILAFYGLKQGDGAIMKGPGWDERSGNWFFRPTHNNLRITRILKSLCTLGLRADAEQFLACLTELRDSEPDCGVGELAFEHWEGATL